MNQTLASTIAAICRERDERFKDSLPLIHQLLAEYGEHDLANRLFMEIPRDAPFEVVADLFDLILHSGNENCSEAIARSVRSWLRQGGDTRRMSIALRTAEKQGSAEGPIRPGRPHRLSNVRRLFKALGLSVLLLAALVSSNAIDLGAGLLR